MSDRVYAPNVGVAGDPEPQGYDLVLNRHVGASDDPHGHYDPFGNGTRIYACPDCGATWNADDLHLESCPRRTDHIEIRALTLTQPWATLVALGRKRIETRSWRTRHRGTLAIHAAKGLPRGLRLGDTLELGPWRATRDRAGLLLRNADDPDFRPYRLPTAAIVALVNLRTVRSTNDPACRPAASERPLGDYTPDRFAWYLNNLDPLHRPVTDVRGALGLWKWQAPRQLLEQTLYHKPEAVTASG